MTTCATFSGVSGSKVCSGKDRARASWWTSGVNTEAVERLWMMDRIEVGQEDEVEVTELVGSREREWRR